MTRDEHIRTAREFLVKSDGYFTEGDVLQGSEKLWGAAAHAVMAVSQHRGWKYGSHYNLQENVKRIADERGDRVLYSDFGVAGKFHGNFYHEFMNDFEIEGERPVVHHFVGEILSLIADEQRQS